MVIRVVMMVLLGISVVDLEDDVLMKSAFVMDCRDRSSSLGELALSKFSAGSSSTSIASTVSSASFGVVFCSCGRGRPNRKR